MSAKAISEQTGKELLYKYICTTSAIQNRFKYARVTPDTDWARLLQDHPWLLSQSLVVKPDQLIKRRGKLGLVGVNLTLDEVKGWLKPRLGQETTVGKARGFLKNFLIEPFVPHSQAEEFYVCIYAAREGDYVLFHHEGGVDVGDVDAKAKKLLVGVDKKLSPEDIKKHLLVHAPEDKKEILASFISGLFNFYEDLYFTYLEINPLVVTKGGVYVLDLAAKVDATADYAKTILSLMTREKHPEGKILIIGGSIANFTNVAATFKGIVRAIRDYQSPLKEHEVTIFVRRGGPNYQEGLRVMGEVGKTTGIPIHVFGTETHMTAIVGMALGHRPIPNQPPTAAHTANFLLNASGSTSTPVPSRTASFSESRADEVAPAKKAKPAVPQDSVPSPRPLQGKSATLFSRHTKAIVWGMQTRAVQGMLDFDYVCSRDEPSVAAMVYPFTGDHKQKFYWGHKEILIPVFKNMADAMKKHPEVDVLINFASLRSAYDSTIETMSYAQIRTIAIIAEGIPEALTRKLIKKADQKGVTIIGPATVGGIKPGCFKIGNTGGMLDNILASKLYRPGSVAYVSRSGGMSNELNNIISRTTDGVYEGVAIGGDRYPGSTFMDHVLRYQDTPGVKMIVVLGEIGGTEEYKICRGIKEGRITKPVVCWCIGTCATMFSSEVQFGHAGACANQASETAVAKNQALKEAGVFVPRSFDELGEIIQSVYEDLVAKGAIVPAQEVPPPTVPMDYSWARELGLIRKPASFMTSICDERGQELIYAGMPITEVFKEEMGIGGVLGLLWFQRRLPKYSCQFIEMCLMVTADHGPAVSGAHNTIICARAGKDLVSSLTSGLLTIGDRFGGALDAAAKMFSKAFDSGIIPMEFVNKMKKEGKLIMGIGHRVKSINNPDMRVQILKDYVKQHFPATPLLDYALEVEKITTSKKPNLILNVDGFIGVAFVDMLRNCGSFTREEADEYIDIGALNGIFVLGRSMGFIGHYLDQKRLKQGLYRHPWDDISYVLPEHMSM
ncbi:ATP citrate lyase [Phyllostomus discolor]|uniref:ATP-citrate synthase n=1 Tax=Phyllostomus discolor TaxID=89673 RepID=A0A833ZGJ8_9CHIR|nr:ATP citrate lyase [Phyllostomus discolor]